MTDTDTELREAAEDAAAEMDAEHITDAPGEAFRMIEQHLRPLLASRDAEIARLKELCDKGWKMIADLNDEAADAQKDSERLRSALQFYADEANYDDEGAPGHNTWASGEVVDNLWESDLGGVAREAIDAEGTASEASKEPT